MTTSLGAKLKHHRLEKGYSLDKLAELTGSSKSYLWELDAYFADLGRRFHAIVGTRFTPLRAAVFR